MCNLGCNNVECSNFFLWCCKHKVNSVAGVTPCDDWNDCTHHESEVCNQLGQCVSTTPAAAGTFCRTDSSCSGSFCNGLTTQCPIVPLGFAPGGTPCNDGNSCTIDDVCIADPVVGVSKCSGTWISGDVCGQPPP